MVFTLFQYLKTKYPEKVAFVNENEKLCSLIHEFKKYFEPK